MNTMNTQATMNIPTHMRTQDIVLETAGSNGSNDPRAIGSLLSGGSSGNSAERQVINGRKSLLILLGGTGAAVGSRFKRRMAKESNPLWSILVFDTDPQSQEAKGDLPGFTEAEYCLLPSEPVRKVIRHPEYHPELTTRFGLSDPKTRSSLARVADRRMSGAGQVRPIGALSMAANYALFEHRIRAAVDGLSQRWTALAERTGQDHAPAVKLLPGLDIYVVCSPCGGTGSAYLIDLGVLLRRQLDVEGICVSTILTLPEVYEEHTQGKPEEKPRMEANCVATMRELDFFQSGRAATSELRVGQPEGPAPSMLFEYVYLVAKSDSQGMSVGCANDVFDLIALHMSGALGTALGGRMEATEANDATVTGLASCPITGRPRNYSTLGATALVVPAERITRYCASRCAREIMQGRLLGATLDAQAAQREVDDWLLAVGLEERQDRGVVSLTSQLKAGVMENLDRFADPLYEDPDPSQPRYLKNPIFTAAFAGAAQRWQDSQLPEITRQLTEHANRLIPDYSGHLTRKVTELKHARGLRPAAAVVVRLGESLQQMADEMRLESRQLQKVAADAATHAERLLLTLNRQLKRFGRDRAMQDEAIRFFRARLAADFSSAAKAQGAVIASALKETCERLAAETRQALAELEAAERRLNGLALEHHAPQGSGQTASHLLLKGGEIDATTPAFVEAFYEQNQPSFDEVCGTASNGDSPWWHNLLDEARIAELCHHLVGRALEHYGRKVDQLTISRALESQLQQGGHTARSILTRFDEVLKACRPLWRAQIPKAGGSFSDTIVVGVPADFSELAARCLRTRGKDIQAALNSDPMYQARMDYVPTHDPHCIYVLRRSHGGLPHYLTAWERYRLSYREWAQHTTHPIHIFHPGIVEDMPALTLRDDDLEGEWLFALGLAYGAVAMRGHYYYLNLLKSERSESFTIPVNSSWNCLAFQDQKLRGNLGALAALVEHGRLQFAEGRQPDRELKLCEQAGRPAALREFLKRPAAINVIRDFHHTLCDACGNVPVARDLEGYVAEAFKEIKPSDERWDQLRRERRLLQREIDRLSSTR